MFQPPLQLSSEAHPAMAVTKTDQTAESGGGKALAWPTATRKLVQWVWLVAVNVDSAHFQLQLVIVVHE